MDDLSYAYDSGNKLLKVTDGINGTAGQGGFRDGTNTGDDYEYDINGNLKIDRNKGITGIEYNHMSLPTKVTIDGSGGTGTIDYVYDATGMKQKKIVSTGTTTEYANGYLYENGTLQFFGHPGGYVEPDGSGGFDYVYQYKDHLGNVRLSYADSNDDGSIDASTEIISEKNYYPFGLQHRGYNNVVNSTNPALKYKFGGKEEQDELGLDMYDFGARNYDPALGRWMNIDPLAEGMRRFSPYNYAWDNPLIYIDPDGMWGKYFDKNGNYLYDDGVDDNKVYTVELSVTTNDNGEATVNAEVTDEGVESDLVDTNGRTISSEETNNDLIGLAIYTRNNVDGAEDAVVNVTSGDRSVARNRRAGGSSGSRHIAGDAADITISGMSQDDAAITAADSGLFSTVIYYPETGDTSGMGTHQETWIVNQTETSLGEQVTVTVENKQTLRPHVHVDNRPRSRGGTTRLRYTGHNGKRNTYAGWKSNRKIQ